MQKQISSETYDEVGFTFRMTGYAGGDRHYATWSSGRFLEASALLGQRVTPMLFRTFLGYRHRLVSPLTAPQLPVLTWCVWSETSQRSADVIMQELLQKEISQQDAQSWLPIVNCLTESERWDHSLPQTHVATIQALFFHSSIR